MKQSVLGEAASLTGRQGIPISLRKPKVYYTGNDTARMGTILRKLNFFYILKLYFSHSRFNIILSSFIQLSQVASPLQNFPQNFAWISLLPLSAACPIHHTKFYHQSNILFRVQILHCSVCSYLNCPVRLFIPFISGLLITPFSITLLGASSQAFCSVHCFGIPSVCALSVDREAPWIGIFPQKPISSQVI